MQTIATLATVAPTPETVSAAQPVAPPTREEIEKEINRVFGKHATVAKCIAFHESGYQEKVTGPKKWINGVLRIGNSDKWHSLDRGVFQLNNHWHAEVSDQDAYTAKTNIAAAYRISQGGTNWNQWATHRTCKV